MTNKRQIQDAATIQRRIEEDEKCRAIFAAREKEKEQKRQMRTAEDAELQ
jgi:hypothetical protein